MEQYEKSAPKTAVDASQDLARNKLNSLFERIEQQDKQIKDLQSDLRKLKNEMRSAVNSWNAKHG